MQLTCDSTLEVEDIDCYCVQIEFVCTPHVALALGIGDEV
jgi:hypothetical protein